MWERERDSTLDYKQVYIEVEVVVSSNTVRNSGELWARRIDLSDRLEW